MGQAVDAFTSPSQMWWYKRIDAEIEDSYMWQFLPRNFECEILQFCSLPPKKTSPPLPPMKSPDYATETNYIVAYILMDEKMYIPLHYVSISFGPI